MGIHYLAYGYNTIAEGMIRRCPDAILIGPAQVHGYGLRFRTYADIELDPTATLHGLLWEVSDDDLRELDGFEHYPEYYGRTTVTAYHGSNPYQAQAYIMVDTSHHTAPSQEYLEKCIRGYTENGMPLDQIREALRRSDALHMLNPRG